MYGSWKLILRRALRNILRRSDASKTEMIRSGVDLTFAASADDVARAILIKMAVGTAVFIGYRASPATDRR
jgi:hypothetical protein